MDLPQSFDFFPVCCEFTAQVSRLPFGHVLVNTTSGHSLSSHNLTQLTKPHQQILICHICRRDTWTSQSSTPSVCNEFFFLWVPNLRHRCFNSLSLTSIIFIRRGDTPQLSATIQLFLVFFCSIHRLTVNEAMLP